jgi:hypothetical protein
MKTGLKKIDELLGTVNKNSVVYGLLCSVAASIYKGIGDLYAGAALLKAMGGIVSRYLRIMVKAVKGFLLSIYYGSSIMEIVGRAAVNSRWAK